MAVIFSLEINFDLRDGPFLARGLEGKAIKFITVITHVVVASQVLLIILQGLTRLILSCLPATAVFDMPLYKNVYVTTSVKMCMFFALIPRKLKILWASYKTDFYSGQIRDKIP